MTSSCIVTEGGLKFLYYSGWSLGRTVPFYFYVGLAISEDGGGTFTRASSAPILDRNTVDPYLTASPWVLVEDGLWRMWYVSGTGWSVVDGEPRHRYHVKYCESRDGVEWTRDGTVCIDFEPGEHAIARPFVVKDRDAYRMWFASRGERYRIHCAESSDGMTWRRLEGGGLDVSSQGWDSEMVEYPIVLDGPPGRCMLYNGNGYGETGIGYATWREGQAADPMGG